MQKKYLFTIIYLLLLLAGCNKPLELPANYTVTIEQLRIEKDISMRDSETSPFNVDTTIEFSKLKYFPVNQKFVFESKLYEYDNKEEITIFGTKGEARKVLKFGYVVFNYDGKEHKINVYLGKSKDGTEYHSIWFTDLTTGKETYKVGRYLDFEYSSDKSKKYLIDFNLAYNPYCAYSPIYSCAIPSKEDFIDIAITAGEKIFESKPAENN
ncbi:MAG: DUF1684 domain-containing protein [Ignavibacteriaceae bacterium]|nr:DUF1684 domain-containing protein [Ignavibacteriaceae bacterium]